MYTFTSFPTRVVLSGDFFVYESLTESDKLSLEGTFSTDCHVNVSVLSVRANKCTLSFLSVVLSGNSTDKMKVISVCDISVSVTRISPPKRH